MVCSAGSRKGAGRGALSPNVGQKVFNVVCMYHIKYFFKIYFFGKGGKLLLPSPVTSFDIYTDFKLCSRTVEDKQL